jgi:hypothetical protein
VLFDNHRIETTEFNEYLPIINTSKEEVESIERLFRVSLIIEKKVTKKEGNKMKRKPVGQSSFDLWRKIVIVEEEPTTPVKLEKGILV